MKWLISRLAEPSTYGGAGLAVAGLLQLAGTGDPAAAAQAAQDAAQVATQEPLMGGALLLGGLLSAILGERSE